MLKKFLKTVLLWGTYTFSGMANAFTITCSLDLASDEHLYRDFVLNSGAHVEDMEPDNFKLGFAHLSSIDAQDKSLMNKVVEEWVKAHQKDLQGLTLDLDEAQWDKDSLSLNTTYLYNQLYKLRDQLQTQINRTSFPSKKVYKLDTNYPRFHLFNVAAGTLDGLPAEHQKRAFTTLRDRLQQAGKIYPSTYTQIKIKEVIFQPAS